MGQAKKRRPCPAVNREITSAECGENRHSRYACPENCPFNPFALANYSELLEMENQLDLDSMKRVVREDPEIVGRIDAAMRTHPQHGMHAAMVWHLYFKRDAGGRTFAARWEQAGFPELKNDLRMLFRAKARMRVALLEMHRVLDEQRFEAVDLLDPASGPRIFVDRSTAARASRFFTVLTWIFPMPHFWRMSGSGVTMSDLGPFSPGEMLAATVAHLGGPAEREAQGVWLAENFVKVNQAITATGLERRRQMFDRLDAIAGSATYELQDSFMACRNALAAEASVEPEGASAEERAEGFAEAMVWLDASPGEGLAARLPGQRVLGRVLLGLKAWRVEAIGGARFDELRRRFEARLGARVRFAKERRDNIGGKLAAGDPSPDLALVPPKLLEQPNEVDVGSSRMPAPPASVSLDDYEAEWRQEQQQAWLDEQLPALGGQTPRAAARQPELRGALIELVKARVRALDDRNLELERADDINGLIRELGLSEIDFPPPPPRPPPDEELDFEGDDDRDELRDFPGNRLPVAITGWSAPPLGTQPLTEAQSIERLEGSMQPFEMAADAIDEIETSGATVLEDAYDLLEGAVGETDMSYFTVFVLRVWFALVPRAGRPPSLRFEVMEAALDRDLAQVGTSISKALLEKLVGDSPQPSLLRLVALQVTASTDMMPKKLRPKSEMVFAMLLVLKALIAEIDYALRRS